MFKPANIVVVAAGNVKHDEFVKVRSSMPFESRLERPERK
jgi:hypothetical protein